MLHDTIKNIIQRAKILSAKNLDLSNSNLNDENIEELLQYFQEIKYTPRNLDLDQNNIGDLGFEKLINFAGIEEINLDRNNVTNKGLTSLKFKKSVSLKKINLSRNALDSSDGSVIELIQTICEHVYIEISLGNNITIQDREAIKSIQDREKDRSTTILFSDLQSVANQVFPVGNIENEKTINTIEIEGFMAMVMEWSKATPDLLYDVARKSPEAKSLIYKMKQEFQELGEIKRQVEYNAASAKPQLAQG